MDKEGFDRWEEARRQRQSERQARRTERSRGRSRERHSERRKARVLHTRVSEDLDEAIRDAADELRVPVSNLVRNVLEDIFEVVEKHKGDAHFHMDIEDDGNWFRVRSDGGVRITDELLDELALLVGPENLSFTRM